jgi:hypothetical protein
MSEFDKRAAVWVKEHVKDAQDINEGTVEFEIESTWNDDGSLGVGVTWSEDVTYAMKDGKKLPGGNRLRTKTLAYSVNQVMRDLVEPGRTPEYPEIGAEIPPGQNYGQAGYVVGECGHRVASQEWRAGLRNCERCGG